MYWLSLELNERLFGRFEVATLAFLAATGVGCSIYQSHKTRQKLLPRRQRLCDLLESLNSSG